MFIPIIFLLVLFTKIVQCENLTDNSTETELATCSCNLNKDFCDPSCCCDTDCSVEEIKTFNCPGLETNKDMTLTAQKSFSQPTCFNDVPIFISNAPYLVEKNGDVVCIKDERNSAADSVNYQRQINQQLDSFTYSRTINFDTGVSSPLGTPTELTEYRNGMSVFRYITSSDTASYYSLPIKAFNSQLCSGLQPITYMNDFTSTCNQPVNAQTCLDALNAEKYTTSFCLITNPSTLAVNRTNICCNTTGNAANWASPTCSNVLQSLTLTIFYTNPAGIDSCTVAVNISASATLTNTVSQTFSIKFTRTGSTPSTLPDRSGNPGYSIRAPIIAGTRSGNTITTSMFTMVRSSTNGDCSGSTRIPIRFGENIQSSCKFSPTNNCPTQADLSDTFLSFTSFDIYVAASGNPNPSTLTDWLSVTYCVFDIGSSNEPTCTSGSRPNPSTNECYTRMDIQIAYANIGAIANPQRIIGAVVFNYQRVNITSTTTLSKPLLLTQTVTFQDLSSAPVTAGDLLPTPNVRQPGDFFYPFILSRATSSISFSAFFYFLIMFVFILV